MTIYEHSNRTCDCRCGHARTCEDCGFEAEPRVEGRRMIGGAEDIRRARVMTDRLVDKGKGNWGNPCAIPGCGIPYTNPETDLCLWHDYQVGEAAKA